MSSDDSALWRSWLDRRDEAAFTALVTRHIAFATGFARRLGCSAADADDVTQRALVRLAGQTREKPGRVGIRAWLGRDVLQESKKSARSRDRRMKYEGMAPPRTAEGLEAVDVRDAVEAALATLDDEDRLAVELRFLHDLEYRDVAFILGCSRLACRLRVHRAVKRMRRNLGRGAPLIVATWPQLSDTPPDAGARIAEAIAAAGPALPASTTPFVIGGLLVGKKTIALAVGLLLLLGGTSYVILSQERGGDASAQDRPSAALDLERHESTLAARAAPTGRRATSDPVAAAAVTDPNKGALEVRVLARDGTGLPDEPFFLSRGGDPPSPLRYRTGRTSADGRGRLDGLEPGRAWVSSGHGPGVSVEIPAGGVAQVEIRLPRGLDLVGTVVDPVGSPVVGADVWIDLGMTRQTGMLAVTKTKADGSFAIQDLDPYASVSARAVGYTPSPCRLLRASVGGTEIVRLVLGGPGTSVRGRVEDAGRSPVAGALVVIGSTGYQPKELPDGAQGSDALPSMMFTAEDGTFSAEGLPPGKTWITVRASGLGPYRAVRELVMGPPPNDWTIALPAGVAMEGVVVDEAGSPVEGADVFIFYDWGNPGRWWSQTDGQGRFRFDDLPSDPPGSVGANHRVKGQGHVAVGGKGGPLDSVVRIVLHPPVLMRVRVVDERGEPIANRIVFARASTWTPRAKPTKANEPTDADGHATIEVGVQGTYEVYVTDPDGEDVQPSSRLRGARPGTDEVTLTVRERDRPTARVVGRVTVPGGHLPDGARAWAVPVAAIGTVGLALDGTNGRFESKLIQPGRYEVSLMADGMGTVPLGRIRVESRQTLDLGDIRLEPPGSLVVKSHGTAGRRYGWQIGAKGARGAVWAPPDPDGTARFPFLTPGRYRITVPPWPVGATPTAGASTSVVIESGRESSVDLTVTPGHVRAVRVQGLATDDVYGLTIIVRAESDDAVLAEMRFPYVFFREGDPELSGAFAPGRYVAEAETADGRKASVSFDVQGDGEPAVVLAGLK